MHYDIMVDKMENVIHHVQLDDKGQYLGLIYYAKVVIFDVTKMLWNLTHFGEELQHFLFPFVTLLAKPYLTLDSQRVMGLT